MTNETRQRIEHYTKLLPGMKEKVMAATMMFVMALAVMVTATYAWITLSSAPEVTSVDTTVAANGSLEIALANGTGSAPGKSSEGDSTGAGNTVNAANITWGNLVNLSDASYGLNKITLRPAALNGTSGLLSNPLYGVGYGTDGRIDTMVTDDDFAYVYYDSEKGDFLVDEDNSHLGVRAVSTFYYGTAGGDTIFADLLSYSKMAQTTAKTNYSSMTNESQEPGKTYIASLEGLIQVYAQFIIDKYSDNTLSFEQLDITEYVPDLYNMMVYFDENVMIPVGESYLYMTDMLDLLEGKGTGDSGYDLNSLTAASRGKTIESYISNNIPSLYQYSVDYNQLNTYLLRGEKADFSDLSDAQKKNSLAYWAYYAENGGIVYWSNISSIINWICDINSATLDGNNLSSLSKMASSILSSSGTHDAKLNKGAIYRMEKRLGEKMSPTISVTVDPSSISSILALAGKVTLDAVLTTAATEPYEIDTDLDTVKNKNKGAYKGSDPVAEDTYAMAIDCWLRTNAGSDSVDVETNTSSNINSDGTETITTVVTSPEKAYLTLEGTVITAEQTVEAFVKDINGDEQPAYTASYIVEGNSVTTDVFLRYGVYYVYDSASEEEYDFEATLKEQLGELPDITYTRKITVEEVIIGYEGANRIWTEDQLSAYSGEGTSTSQGRGSCYVFYADTPADQSRFLELLGAMKVVFVNAQGIQIGIATMDTENYFAQNGKVTVPLVLDKTQATNLGTDTKGNTIYGLTPLKKNVATRITALVYLDGSRLTNEMVLASGDIQGTLNIQFGCSTAVATTTTTTTGDEVQTTVTYAQGTDSMAIDYETLMDDYISVSATASETSFEYNPEQPATSTLNVKVAGVEPESVSGRFIRAISSTQGVQQDSITLSGEGSDWNTTCTFDKPGNYILRTIWVDGIEYDLEEPVSITVTGSSVNSVTCDALSAGSRNATIMTADSSFSTDMTLGFTTSAQIPNTVTGIFVDEEGRQINVPFTLINGEWKGEAIFTTSGTFTMEYVDIDGDIYELSDYLKPTLEIMLGLKVRTWVTATQETLTKLQSIYDRAVATNFVLDTSAVDSDGNLLFDDGVTLLVSAEVYDNNGNEISGLGNVTLYYGRAGSSVLSRGLKSTMSWDSDQGRYAGKFLVDEAGTFNFTQVTVETSGKTNSISSYTVAPQIQAMPPEDAYYFNNYTDEYQYAPDNDAEMVIGIAYSSAAARVTATITNGSFTEEVEGIMGIEATDQGEDSVNLWSFKVPTVNGLQNGEWELTKITMYGVYYEGVYYGSGDGARGIQVDLSKEGIQTKVVNNLYVTLSGKSDTFTGDFMDSHIVSDMTVKIADYNGDTIDGIEISDLYVTYYLDTTAIGVDSDYGYSVEKDSVEIKGKGDLPSGSDNVYSISAMNFQYAGPYNTCKISFKVNGTIVDSSKIVYKYMDGGTLSETYPTYEVIWNSPTVTVTGTDPAESEEFNINLGGGANDNPYPVHNYFEDYYARVYCQYGGMSSCMGQEFPNYEVSQITLKLTNAGKNISSDNSVIFAIPAADAENASDNVFTFTSNDSSIKNDVGQVGANGSSSTDSSYYTRYLPNKTIKTVIMNYDGTAFTVKLSNPVTINSSNSMPASLNYNIPEEYKDLFAGVDISEQTGNNDGRTFNVTLPTIDDFVMEVSEASGGDQSSSSTENKTVYYSITESGTCSSTTTYYPYTRTIVTEKTSSTKEIYEVTYKLAGWKFTKTVPSGESFKTTDVSKTYAPGSEFAVSSGASYTATPIFEEIKRTFIGSETAVYVVETTTDTAQASTTSKPDGTDVGEAGIYATPQVKTWWE